jgi:pyruvate formate lyase activating enzyme
MIFNVQRFCIHDGPGIRTTVFLKGCPMRCSWCHNPEGISPAPGLSFDPRKCIGCGYCLRVCPEGAHVLQEDGHALRREVCVVCGQCTEECFARALELVGREATVEEVLAEVQRDRPFYDVSGGGMTVSGGEPLFQIDFTAALLACAKAEGLHCCVETSGYADFRCFERILESVDLFLYDIKDMDDKRHVEQTGVPNSDIIANLRALHAAGAAIRLRLPIIPGFNDRPDHIQGVAALVSELPNLRGVELMPHHRLGAGKRDRLGVSGQAQEPESPGKDAVGALAAELEGLGVPVMNAPDRH